MKKFLVLLYLSLFSAASAAIISADLSHLGSNSWQVEYTVTNDSPGSVIEAFSVYFDLGLYENLTILSSPADWDTLVLQPDPLVPDDGLFDALALSSGISTGTGLSGFTLSFDWLGVGSVATEQAFEVYNPNTFDVLDSGLIALNGADVPEPSSLFLVFAALTAAFSLRRRTS